MGVTAFEQREQQGGDSQGLPSVRWTGKESQILILVRWATPVLMLALRCQVFVVAIGIEHRGSQVVQW